MSQSERYGVEMLGPLLTFVDDSEADHFLIQDALGALNVRVRSQHFLHVRQFLAALDRGEITPDAVITDLKMPVLCGFDLLESVRSRHPDRTVPLIVFSTSRAPADYARAAALNVDGYFVKPVSYDGLVEQLRAMVDLIHRCQKEGQGGPKIHIHESEPALTRSTEPAPNSP